MAQTPLKVHELVKRFDGLTAVAGISFEARAGEVFGFLGPNGAGKTTTIRMIMGIIRPDAGRIEFFFDGKSGPLDKGRIGYLPEERGLYEDAKVIDVLVYFAELKGVPPKEARRRALAWLERLDLGEWAHRKIEKLSKGMQQKVQLVAAILHEPDLVVLDEPFAGLDPVNQDLFKELIRGLRDAGAAVLLSSHQMNLVEELCDRIFLIHKGRQVLYGCLSEIKAAHGGHRVELRFRGDGSLLQGNGLVKDLELADGRARFTLPQGVEPERFLRDLPEGLGVEEITVRRPSLHEIFVGVVKGG
jgi:ABC-2 type transport system ATP-binding protein